MIDVKPSENVNLYNLDFYFNELIDLYNKKKMPNKILLSGKKGVGKSTLAYHLTNYILSENEEFKYNNDRFYINEKNRSYKLVQNKSHPNFYLLDLLNDKKNIHISQVREMISYTNKSSFNDKPRIVLIDNIDTLNINSVNALLKIIEEPNKNIFFILIHNNEKKILPTLKSRCLIFNIHISFNECLNICNLLLNKKLIEVINLDLINYYNTPGEFIKLINFASEKEINLNKYTLIKLLNLLIDNAYYKKNKYVKRLLINLIELYFLKKYKISKTKNSFLNIYHYFIEKFHNAEKFNLDDESLFLEFKLKLLNG